MENASHLSAEELFDRYAVQYAENHLDQSRYADGLDRFAGAVGPGRRRVLEAGCGPGNVARFLLGRQPEWFYLGVDLAPNMVRLAQLLNPEGLFFRMDVREIAQLNRRYDGILAPFILPYLDREAAHRLVLDLGSLLAPGGVIYLSCMEADRYLHRVRERTPGEKLIQHFHSEDDLKAFLAEAGIRHMETFRQPVAETDGSGAKFDLVLLGQS